MHSALQDRWSKFSTRLAIKQQEVIWSKFVEYYSGDDRHYHDLQHLQDCLTKLDQWPEEILKTTRDSIELAIWFHDVIYDTHSPDNEKASADLASHHLRNHPLSASCNALIMATKHNSTLLTPAEKILCDIDLSILGSSSDKYLTYTENIRKEYHWVEAKQYAIARAKVLNNFQNRITIFQTPHGYNRWEKRSRINIANELSLHSI